MLEKSKMAQGIYFLAESEIDSDFFRENHFLESCFITDISLEFVEMLFFLFDEVEILIVLEKLV